MTRLMYDSVSAVNIPTDAQVVAGYVNGRYKWSRSDWLRFPRAQLVRIQVYIPGQPVIPGLGDVLDIEAGDAPTQRALDAARIWVGDKFRTNMPACIYTSKSTAKFLRFEHCAYWLADYTGAPHLLPGTVATQYVDKGPFDLSVVADGWPYVSTPSQPQPQPQEQPYRGARYMFVPITIDGTDEQGNAYHDLPGHQAQYVVNVVMNTQNPQTQGYVKLPVFDGCLQLGDVVRLVFTGGAPKLGSFAARVILDER